MWFVTQMLHQFCGRTSRTQKIWMGCSQAGTRSRRSTILKPGRTEAPLRKKSAVPQDLQTTAVATEEIEADGRKKEPNLNGTSGWEILSAFFRSLRVIY